MLNHFASALRSSPWQGWLTPAASAARLGRNQHGLLVGGDLEGLPSIAVVAPT
jgi:hypothetical protein